MFSQLHKAMGKKSLSLNPSDKVTVKVISWRVKSSEIISNALAKYTFSPFFQAW